MQILIWKMNQPHENDSPSVGHGSITHWMRIAKQGGDSRAHHEIYQRYSARLAGLVRVKLRSGRRRSFDEEDVVSESMNKFFEALEVGACASMSNREDLWNYLVRIAERRAVDMLRREGRVKRGGGRVLGEQTAFSGAGSDSQSPGLENLPDLADPTPEMAEQVASCCYDWFCLLDAEERQIVNLKGQGYSNKEIANAIDRVERSVERKLKAIRSKLSKLDC